MIVQTVRGKKIRILVVDESAILRMFLASVIAATPDLELIGEANDVYLAREKLVSLKPDVMILAFDMPKMDGVTFLEKVMQYFPTRTLMINTSSTKKSETFLSALAAGAIDVMDRPSFQKNNVLEKTAAAAITDRIRNVFRSSLQRSFAPLEGTPIKKGVAATQPMATKTVVAIAASTGGTEALKVLLAGLPAEIPPILIVQHMPPGFTKSFAASLDRTLPFVVKEAEHQEPIESGKVLFAPGGFHLEAGGVRGSRFVRLHQQDPLHGLRPSADYLFSSLAQCCGVHSVGVILTGIGRDGANGLAEIKRAGGTTMVQSEESCVVFGMPHAAIQMNIVDRVLPPAEIANALVIHWSHKGAA